MSDTYTITEAAAVLGISPAWARRLAARHGIGQIKGRTRILSQRQLDRLREAAEQAAEKAVGNPNFGK